MRCLAVFCLILASQANASVIEERIQLHRGKFGKGEAFLSEMLVRLNSSENDAQLTTQDIYVGWHDLNSDGTQELLVAFLGVRWCGPEQCAIFVY